MTVTMTTKNQVTIPKKITTILGLGQGTMFKVEVSGNKIELIPLEVKEKAFSKEEHHKLELLSRKEQGKEKKVTAKFIKKLEKAS